MFNNFNSFLTSKETPSILFSPFFSLPGVVEAIRLLSMSQIDMFKSIRIR